MKKKILALPLTALSIISLASCNFINNQASSSSIIETTTNSTNPQTSSSSNTSTTTSSGTTNTTTTSSNTTTSPTTTSSTNTSTTSTTNTTSKPITSSSSSSISTTTIPVQTSSSSTSKSSKAPTSTITYSSIPEDNKGITITELVGYNEAAYVKFEATAESYNCYYKKDVDQEFTKVDDELIRIDGENGRVDILGLNPGNYLFKIENKTNNSQYTISKSVVVTEQDRSGYAHFNYSNGVGAYNDDGTLKDNAVVVYVNDSNKNTVTAKIGNNTYTGLSDILKHSNKDDIPVNIRILGKISAATWGSDTPDVSSYTEATTTTIKGKNNQYLNLQNYTEEEIIEAGYNELDTSIYSKLDGLTNKIKYDSSKKEFDSYYNMLDISGARNVTVEGVGQDAEIFQWGFTWKSDCKSIEIKNLTFDDYTEDACSFEGSGSDSALTSISSFTSTRYWIHNNTFNRGVNYWDVCSEQDKNDGDGATDFKRVAYVTVAYNEYYNNHKTGLVGGADTQMTSCLTFHHNYYNQCQSRLPFAREANMHMYNNYYYKSSGNNMQIYAGAYAFIENCYFKDVKNTYSISDRGIATAAVKSYNNIYDNSSNYSSAFITTNRCEPVENGNVFANRFDTNSNVFYFNKENNISDVSLMLDVNSVPTYIPMYAGAGKLIPLDYSLNTTEENESYDDTDDNAIPYTDTIPTQAGIYYHAIDSSNTVKNEADVTDANKVTYTNNTLRIADTSNTLTTIGYYVLSDNDIYTSGTITYSFDVTLQGVGSKWNFARFLDKDGNELCAIRMAESTKNISYTINGDDTTVKQLDSHPFKAGTYSISLTVNYDNNTAIIKVNDYQDTITSFDKTVGIFKFMTAVSATDRSFIVTNIEITEE